jgi:hypothetical protein
MAKVEDEFLYYTQRAGEVCRQLGLAGVGAVWILQRAQSPEQGFQRLPWDLKISLGFIFAGLAVDALQYGIGSWLWWLLVLSHMEHTVQSHRVRLTWLFGLGQLKLFLMLCGCGVLAFYAFKLLY